MLRYSLILLTTITLVFNGFGQKSKKTAEQIKATDLKVYGRSIIKDQKLELISSAAHIGFTFEGNQCEVYITIPDYQSRNYIQYELDGVYQKRIKLEGKSKAPIVIPANGKGKHTVWIYKATEAHTGPIWIEKIVGSKVKPLEKPRAPIIEFIGNSITCGAAADPSEVPCNTGEYHDQHNAYMAYGPRLARSLKTDFVLSSVSGYGVYRNWNSDGPTLPQVYEKVDFQESNTRQWDFKTFNPQIVSIALGTNDFSNGDGKKPRMPFDSAAYVSTYIRFVSLVKSKYPQAKIVLLSSPMVGGDARVKFQNCLTAVKTSVNQGSPNDKPIDLFFFQPMQARGCTGHPSVEDHEMMANELRPFFESLLNK
jgi:hypothetical protein